MQEIILGAVAQGLLWSLMAIGIYITYRVLDIADLTAEGGFTLGASVVGNIVTSNGIYGMSFFSNPYFATIVAIFAGMLAGIVTGILHTKLKIPALLSGILTMTALYSINLKIMGKALITMTDKDFNIISILRPLENMKLSNKFINDYFPSFVYQGNISRNFAASITGFVIVVFVIALLWLFFNTEIGFMLRATGSNENMVRALGTNTDNTKILGLAIGNALVGLGSALVGQFNGFVDASMGVGTIVIGLSSVIIGEVLFCNLFELLFKKRTILLGLISVVLGSVLYRLIIAYVLKKGLNTNDLKLFTSIILATALSFPLIGGKIKKFLTPILKNLRSKKIIKEN